MSSKTRTRKPRTTTASTSGSTRALRSVPEPTTVARVGTETEDKLWEALHANPNSTAADLSSVAKIGKSTAQKILVKWAGEGSVARTAGIAESGRRAADLWVITEVDAEPTDNDPANATRWSPRTPSQPMPSRRTTRPTRPTATPQRSPQTAAPPRIVVRMRKHHDWHRVRCAGWSRTTCGTTPARSSARARSARRLIVPPVR